MLLRGFCAWSGRFSHARPASAPEFADNGHRSGNTPPPSPPPVPSPPTYGPPPHGQHPRLKGPAPPQLGYVMHRLDQASAPPFSRRFCAQSGCESSGKLPMRRRPKGTAKVVSRLKQRRPCADRRNLAHVDGHYDQLVVELLGCLNPSPFCNPQHRELLDLLDPRVPLHDRLHDQTLPEPAVLGADLAEPISIA